VRTPFLVDLFCHFNPTSLTFYEEFGFDLEIAIGNGGVFVLTITAA
jgi:hypothetical protein